MLELVAKRPLRGLPGIQVENDPPVEQTRHLFVAQAVFDESCDSLVTCGQLVGCRRPRAVSALSGLRCDGPYK